MEFDRDTLSSQLIKSYIAENEEEQDESTIKVKYLVPLIMLAVIGFVTYGWYADKFAISTADNGNVPLIRSEKSVVRVKPDDPGGMQVANQDKRVYETISNSVNRDLPKVTRLLPAPEAPIDREHIGQPDPSVAELLDDMGRSMPDMAPSAGGEVSAIRDDGAIEVAGLGTEIQQRGIVGLESGVPDGTIAIEEDVLRELIKQEKAKIMQKIQEEKERLEKEKENAPVETAPEKTEEAGDPEEEASAPGGGPVKSIKVASLGNEGGEKFASKDEGLKELTPDDIKHIPTPKMKTAYLKMPDEKQLKEYHVQLGSYKTETDVATNWRRMKMHYSSLLDGLEYKTEKADLGEKGIFYRLKVGPFSKEDDARQLCQQLREQNQGCLFVRK